jgi:hypothetical protein
LPGWVTAGATAFFVAIGGSVLAFNYFMHTWPMDYAMDGVQGLQVERMPTESYNILVANLEDDEEGRQTRHVAHALETGFSALNPKSAVQVQRAMRELSLGWSQGVMELGAAEKEGQSWLERFNADVLIWGSVAEKGKPVLRLRFLSRDGGQSRPAKGYQVGNETLQLEPSFGSDLASVLVGQAAAAASPANGTASYIADVLRPQVKRLGKLCAEPPAPMSAENVALVREAYAFSQFKLGDQAGETAAIDIAVVEFRKLADYFRSRDLRRWAATQDRLGNALLRLGERTNRGELLQQALSAYAEALKVTTRQDAPHEWAIVKNDSGNALLRIGEREPETTRIEEAMAAYRDALSVLDPDTSLDWAMVQNNYGTAL